MDDNEIQEVVADAPPAFYTSPPPSPIEDLWKAQALLDDEFRPFVRCTPIITCGIAVLVILILAILIFACVEGTVV